MSGKEHMNNNQISKEWWDWYLTPPINYKEVYGDAFEWTDQEKNLMVLIKLSEQGGQE